MTHGCALILIEFMDRCCTGFGRAESTGTLMNIIGAVFELMEDVSYCLVLEMHHAIPNSTSMAMIHGSGLILIYLAWIYRFLSW